MVEGRSFEEEVESVFGEIGRYASDNARVVVALLAALRSIGEAARSAGARVRLPILVELAEAVTAPAIEAAVATRDRELLKHEMERVRAELS